ncbi:hypothetical protein GNF82_12145 [Clostridium perfringens]
MLGERKRTTVFDFLKSPKKKRSTIELLLDIEIDGVPVTFTGTLLKELMDRVATKEKFYLMLDVEQGTGHTIARTQNELTFLTKTDWNSIKNLQKDVEPSNNFMILTEEDLFPVIDKLAHDKNFIEGMENVEIERAVSAAGEEAYKLARYANYKYGVTHSINSDPNIRRYRTEQIYRQMYKEEKFK